MDKSVILARGLGTRMRKADVAAKVTAAEASAADSGVKALIPITGAACEDSRPFLDYVLTALAGAGYTKACMVIGPEHEAVRGYYSQTAPARRLKIEFAIQENPLGTADAVAAARDFAGDDHFLAINSDNYYPPQALAGLRQLGGCGLAAFDHEALVAGSNIAPQRIARFAVIESRAGLLTRVLEKPDPATLARLPRPHLVSMNCWRLGPSIFEACRRIEPSPRGELELTSAVQCAIDQLGEKFHVRRYSLPVLDLSSREDIAPVKKALAGAKVDY
jgi:dTDP-glucose pyrophosphorylase